jgi:aminoglycoside/choline kinase family phosphotransferase
MAYLIDFQGMRPGLAEYDVASLLYDPYVELSDREHADLIDYYIERQRELGCDSGQQFQEVLPLCAIQRLMQALGAYGFLGLVKKQEAFLQYIPSALRTLSGIVSRQPELEPVVEVAAEAVSACDSTQSADIAERRKHITRRA